MEEVQADEAGDDVVEGEMNVGAAFVADGQAAERVNQASVRSTT